MSGVTKRELHPTGGYEHVTIVESGRVAYLAGQCPVDQDQQVVGIGDLEKQIEQVAANSLAALEVGRARSRRTWSARSSTS